MSTISGSCLCRSLHIIAEGTAAATGDEFFRSDAGAGGSDTFREEGLYAFRFDLNDDSREEVTFKIRFGEVPHAAGDEHRHVQSFEVRGATGHLALRGAKDLTVARRLYSGWEHQTPS
jgi:hypothetical protein